MTAEKNVCTNCKINMLSVRGQWHGVEFKACKNVKIALTYIYIYIYVGFGFGGCLCVLICLCIFTPELRDEAQQFGQ